MRPAAIISVSPARMGTVGNARNEIVLMICQTTNSVAM
jgi:hypothetical protein